MVPARRCWISRLLLSWRLLLLKCRLFAVCLPHRTPCDPCDPYVSSTYGTNFPRALLNYRTMYSVPYRVLGTAPRTRYRTTHSVPYHAFGTVPRPQYRTTHSVLYHALGTIPRTGYRTTYSV